MSADQSRTDTRSQEPTIYECSALSAALNIVPASPTALTVNDSLVTSITLPLGLGPNTLRGPNIYQFDLRCTRYSLLGWCHQAPRG